MTLQYRHEWAKHQSKLLGEMQELLGITFYKPVIDVSVAPFFIPQSDPLIVNFGSSPDRFVDVLTHELTHVLLTDNNKMRTRDEEPKLDLIKEWQRMFGKEHDFNTLVHIPVHAVFKHLFTDVLKDPKRVERDIKESATFAGGQAYVSAWEYVNKHDYKTIVDKLRSLYTSVG